VISKPSDASVREQLTCFFHLNHISSERRGSVDQDLRLSLWLWNASFNALDLRSTEASNGTLMLGSSEIGANRAFQFRYGGARRGLSLSSLGSHCYEW